MYSIENNANKKIMKSIGFTLMALVIFCLGSNVPVPGINRNVLQYIFNGQNAGLFDLFNLFTGGSFQNFTIFALGVNPYITASIIIQLFTIAFPYFEGLSQEGEPGQKKMNKITRYLTVVLAFIQSIGLVFGLFRSAVTDRSALNIAVIMITLISGTCFLMWLGDKIQEHGVGNGMSILIFAGIVCRVPTDVADIIAKTKSGQMNYVADALLVLAILIIVIGIIFIQQGVRKIPIQYAQRFGNGGPALLDKSHLPIKVNTAGVIPIIFAMTILQVPLTVAYFIPKSKYAEFITKYVSPSGSPGIWIYMAINMLLIIAFTYFYTDVVFKYKDIAKNLGQSGGMIPSIRQGTDTEEYLKMVSHRLCFISAIFLAVVAILPTIAGQFANINMSFGGTSILIMIGVSLETIQQIRDRIAMNRIPGFLN